MYTRPVFTLFFLLTLFSTSAFTQDYSNIRKKEFNIKANGLAIDGYDPVAYFVSNKADKGQKEFSTIFQGIIYLFSSASNKEEFKRNPAKYEPQYGFYNKYFNNTLTSWNKDEAKLRQQADQSWSIFFINLF